MEAISDADGFVMNSAAAVGYMLIAAQYDGLSRETVSELKALMETFMESKTEEYAEGVCGDLTQKIEQWMKQK